MLPTAISPKHQREVLITHSGKCQAHPYDWQVESLLKGGYSSIKKYVYIYIKGKYHTRRNAVQLPINDPSCGRIWEKSLPFKCTFWCYNGSSRQFAIRKRSSDLLANNFSAVLCRLPLTNPKINISDMTRELRSIYL